VRRGEVRQGAAWARLSRLLACCASISSARLAAPSASSHASARRQHSALFERSFTFSASCSPTPARLPARHEGKGVSVHQYTVLPVLKAAHLLYPPCPDS
jgi:hypothetical protein